uniref:Uncharacterized protein n=1 Tax=Anguilla anguilla TaxID=7936 RepID=A0A0E9VS63_ANGAN
MFSLKRCNNQCFIVSFNNYKM